MKVNQLRRLLGDKLFSKIDVSHAYQQVELDEDSQKYLTINTHRGLYRCKRLPFGVSSAPAIFQRIMDQLLQGLSSQFAVWMTSWFQGVPLRNIWQSWSRFSSTYKIMALGWIQRSTSSSSWASSFLDTGLTKMTFVPSLRRWMQSCKPRVLPMSQSWSRIWDCLTIMASSCPIWRLHCILFMTFCKRIDLGSGQRRARECLLRVRSSYKILLCWSIMIWRSHFGWPVMHHPMGWERLSPMLWRTARKSLLLLHLELSKLVSVTIPR